MWRWGGVTAAPRAQRRSQQVLEAHLKLHISRLHSYFESQSSEMPFFTDFSNFKRSRLIPLSLGPTRLLTAPGLSCQTLGPGAKIPDISFLGSHRATVSRFAVWDVL